MAHLPRLLVLIAPFLLSNICIAADLSTLLKTRLNQDSSSPVPLSQCVSLKNTLDGLSQFEKAKNAVSEGTGVTALYSETFDSCPVSGDCMGFLCSHKKFILGVDASQDAPILKSPNSQFGLFYTLRGKLQIREIGDEQSSVHVKLFETSNARSTWAEFNHDGSIVLYDGATPVWKSVPETQGCRGATLALLDNGKLMVDCKTDTTDDPIWTSEQTFFAASVASPQVPNGNDVIFYRSPQDMYSTWYSPKKHCKMIFDGGLKITNIERDYTRYARDGMNNLIKDATSMVLSKAGNVELRRGTQVLWRLAPKDVGLSGMRMTVEDRCEVCIQSLAGDHTYDCNGLV